MKKLICLLLILAMAVSLWACSQPEENGNNGGGEESSAITEKYDENGRIIMKPVYMGWNLWNYNEYSYNDAGKVENVKFCRASGELVTEWKYFYDDLGILEMVQVYSNATEPVLITEEFYDEYGVLRRKQNYETDGSLADYTIYEYDSQGRCVEEIYYSEYWSDYEEVDSPLHYILYSYDQNDNCIQKERLDRDENLIFYWTYTYDELQNVITETNVQIVDGEEYSTVTQYEYHDNGKVMEKIIEGSDERIEEYWDATGAMEREEHYELAQSGNWFLKYSVEYSDDTKVHTDYQKDGKYTVQTMIGNAQAAELIKTAYYNADDSVFCICTGGEYFDASGNKLSEAPNLSGWTK